MPYANTGGLSSYLQPSNQANTTDLINILSKSGGLLGSYLGAGSPTSNLYGRLGSTAGGSLAELIRQLSLPNSSLISSLGGTITSPVALGGIGGALGSLIGGKYAPLTAGLGGMGGSVLGSLLSNRPISGTSIGGGLGSMLGGYLGSDYGKLGSVLGGGLGNIGGQLLTSALFPSAATGLAGGLAGGVGGLATGLLGSVLKNDAAQAANVLSPGLSVLSGQVLQPALTSAISSLTGAGAGAGAAGAAGTAGSLLGGLAGPAMGALSTLYKVWADAKAKKSARHASEREYAARNAALAEAWPQFEPLYQGILSEGKKRLTAKVKGVDPGTGLTDKELMTLFSPTTGMLSTSGKMSSDTLFRPATKSRSEFAHHYGEQPWSYAAQQLMTGGGLKYNKILPWLQHTTEQLTLPKNIDPYTYQFKTPDVGLPISQSILDARYKAVKQYEDWQNEQKRNWEQLGAIF